MTDGDLQAKHDRLLYFFKIFRRGEIPEGEHVPTGKEIVDALNQVPIEKRFIVLPRSRNRVSYVHIGTEDGMEKIILTTCRRFWSKVQDWSKVNQGEMLRDLRLKDKQDLAETAHLVIFPDGIMGIEFNQQGPKMSQFEALFNTHCEKFGIVVFLMCMRKTTHEAIKNNRELKKARLRIWSTDMGAVQPKNLRDNLIGAMNVLDIDNIEIVIRKPGNEKSKFEKIATKLINGLVGYKPFDKHRKPKLKADAVDEHGLDYAFNLLRSQISLRRTITFDDNEESRYIDSNKWFETIVREKKAQQVVLDNAVYAELGEDDDE